MSSVRVLVGTRKGAFILTADGKRQKWEVSGPHFGGWEIYHLKGSPVDPNRIYASQIERLVRPDHPALRRRRQDAGRPVGNKFVYDGVARHAPVVRRHAASLGIQARLASRAVADRSRHGLRRRRGRRALPHDRRRPDLARAAGPSRPRLRPALAARRRRHVPAHDPARSRPTPNRIFIAISAAGAFRTDDGGKTWKPINRGLQVRVHPRPGRRGRPLRAPHRDASVAPRRAVHAEALGRDAHRQRRRIVARSQRQPADATSASRSTCTPTSPRRSTSCRSRATREHYPPDGKLRVYRSRTGGNEWEALTKGLPQKDCYVNVLRDAMAVDSLDSCGIYFGTTGGQVYGSPDARRHLERRSSATCRRCSRSKCRRWPAMIRVVLPRASAEPGACRRRGAARGQRPGDAARRARRARAAATPCCAARSAIT